MSRVDYKNKLKQLLQSNPNPMPFLRDDPECVISCHNLLDELFKVMLSYKQDYGIKWLMGLERYVKDKKETIRTFNRHLDRGHLVQVELFGHFNKELSFMHPAVVLFDSNDGWLLVAPISTPKNGSNNDFYIDVDEQDGLDHPSAVCLDDIRAVDKNRVLYQLTKNGTNCKLRSAKLNEIDEVILKYFLPFTYRKYLELERDLQKERELHDKTREELLLLKESLSVNEIAATSDLDN